SRGISIIYISHRLGEVKELADRVVVLRDGCNAGELAKDEINHDNMVKLMIGRDLSQFYQRAENKVGDIILQVENLHTAKHPKQSLSFEVRAGEIVGIAGLVGAGRTELMEALFGIESPRSGTIRVNGKPVEIHSPIDAIRAGLALVPEDRKGQGLILEMAIRENVGLPNLRRTQRSGFLNFKGEREISRGAIQSLNVKAAHDGQAVQLLSGGNQQKVVLGKWLAMSPRVFLLDEPTRGVDIGAKQEIYQLMETLAAQGAAILFASSEMTEILGISDRVLVMHEGRLAGELARDQQSEEAVMQLATGGAVAVV
ncbi:MAG TPA: sugar ABC transporter ATP-binding protein, partial [Abditibacteriaceae bacterium]